MVIHCASERQARMLRAKIVERFRACGLELNHDKTRVVYCKDTNRKGSYEHAQFTFLGYTFRARKAKGARGEYFISFLPAMSPEALKAKGVRLRELRIHRRTDLTLFDLARWLNPIVAGWMNFYGRFYHSAMEPLLLRINAYLRRWAGKKYQKLRTHKAFRTWWAGLTQRQPRLFAHWQWALGWRD